MVPGLVSGQEALTDSLRLEQALDSLRGEGMIFGEYLSRPKVELSTGDAIGFLEERLSPEYWKDKNDPLRRALLQLVFNASNPPYDSTEYFLSGYPFDSLDVTWDKFYIWEPVRLRIPSAAIPVSDSANLSDTSLIKTTLSGLPADSLIAARVQGELYNTKDTTILVVVDTLHEVSSGYKGFPYSYYTYPFQSDSTRAAVQKLMDYLKERDSTLIYFTGSGSIETPVWLNSKADRMKRFWLRNDINDSVTVWIGSTSRNTIGLYLEDGVVFRRPMMQSNISEARIEYKEVDRSKLLEVQKITVKQQFWKYRSESVLALNQTSMTNWVKGGESSISTSLDITGYADYNNKNLKLISNNFARVKYGLIKSGDSQIRKNLDLLETNSKVNHKAFGKFDFSAVMLFKTQVAKGYTYPNDTTKNLVSKFMNPGTLTVGFGLDYKPDKKTSINFSPFSYKGTFVTDTALIDQTKYGVAADKRAKHEPGASLVFSNEFSPAKAIKVVNRVQLFTNYINKPQNIDIDWEMIFTANINWFTDVRFNTHLIFDNDTKTPDYDNLGPDGKPKKTARVQFKELLGFSFVFRF